MVLVCSYLVEDWAAWRSVMNVRCHLESVRVNDRDVKKDCLFLAHKVSWVLVNWWSEVWAVHLKVEWTDEVRCELSILRLSELMKWGVSCPSSGCAAAPREVWVRSRSNFGNTKKKKNRYEIRRIICFALSRKNIIQKYVMTLTAQQIVRTKIQFAPHI